MGLNQTVLMELQQEAKITRRLLERVPEGALGWKPHEKSMTLGRLASHVAELPGLIELILKQDELDFALGAYKPLVATNVAELLEMFDKCISRASDQLKTATDEQL